MIHYHGTPCGGMSFDLPRLYSGRHAMLSYYNKQDEGVIADCCQSFLIDNGAFSHWKHDGEADDQYWDYFMEWLSVIIRHPSCDGYIIPDTITGTLDENRRLMYKYGQHPLAIPVFHYHEPLDHLQSLIDNKMWGKIALGSSAEYTQIGTATWWARTHEIWNVIAPDGYPRKRIHGLRMLDTALTSVLPFSSADSTNAVINAKSNTRFGMYKLPTASQRAAQICDCIEAVPSCPIYIPQTQQIFQLSSCANG